MELRRNIEQKLTSKVLDEIADAAKPTKTAEVVAVVKQFPGMALSLEEIALIANIAEPGRDVKARASDYDVSEVQRYPEMLIVREPHGVSVRYSPKSGF